MFSAYVCGERSGIIPEKPHRLGETLNGVSGLDIEYEKKLIDTNLDELTAEGATETEIEHAMKDVGTKR